MKLWKLTVEVQAVCPCEGINTNGDIFFIGAPTESQRAEAQALIDKYLPVIDFTPER